MFFETGRFIPLQKKTINLLWCELCESFVMNCNHVPNRKAKAKAKKRNKKACRRNNSDT